MKMIYFDWMINVYYFWTVYDKSWLIIRWLWDEEQFIDFVFLKESQVFIYI